MVKVAAAASLVSVALAKEPTYHANGREIYGATGFSAFPGYRGRVGLPPSPGLVTVTQASKGVVSLNWHDLYGDPNCDGSPGYAVNSCGLHIHWGTSCYGVEGRMWDMNGVDWDPWQGVRYTYGQGMMNVQVETGYPASELVAHGVIIIHDYYGYFMACSRMARGVALMSTPPQLQALQSPATWQAANFSVYPGYSGSVRISSNSSVMTASQAVSGSIDAVKLTWQGLQGDPECNGERNGVSNSCGLHIHFGTSCEAGAVQGHMFKTGFLGPDPWTNVTYVHGQNGHALVATGFSVQKMAEEGVLVAHDKLGQRVACSKLSRR